MRPTAPARLPPSGITGLDPAWSRLVTAPDHSGERRTWHLLDTHPGAGDVRLTLFCVHGNPSWSFLWRSLLASAPTDVRVVAVDQLDMGFSERTGRRRRLADRIADLIALVDHLEIEGPIVTVAHDWGGPISLGLAHHLFLRGAPLRGIVLTNTAVHQPEGASAPTVIRAARLPGVLHTVTVRTRTFVRAAYEMARPRLDAEVREGFLAPYLTAERRHAIADFVDDIPLDPAHPSAAALDAVAAALDDLVDVPALLLWGPSDLVFSDLYLHDLERRFPQAEVHRFVGASHFVQEQADVAGAVLAWLEDRTATEIPPPSQRQPLWAALDARADSEQPAVVDIGGGASITFAQLHHRVTALARGLADHGVHPGDRVALMIPPGIDLTVAVYACWRMGAVMVLVDSGLGPRNMSRALRAADPAHLIGVPRALAAARALRWPGRRIAVADLAAFERRAANLADPPTPVATDPAAVVFTSGSTGPSKGVVYRHAEVQAQRDLLAELYRITPDDRLVAAFAPFALYGPALGITSVVPDMDVTRPGTLTAATLGEAVAAIEATLVFASPAALSSVVASEEDDGLAADHRKALRSVRTLLSAGAPVRPELLAAAVELMPNAEAHTPYGMTEVLPVASISLSELVEVSTEPSLRGVCVGRLAPGVEVEIEPFGGADFGEVLVSAAHGKRSYDRLWFTEQRTRRNGWHRTGDVGSLDETGRLWIGGRLEHVIEAMDGPIMPVGLEQAVEQLAPVERAAAVGVGPAGSHVVVMVVERLDDRGNGLAEAELTTAVRDAVSGLASIDVAAVLCASRLPVDKRHNSKVDRRRLARWAERVLAGGRIGSP